MSRDLTALYERLSHDDELQGESNSISNQGAMPNIPSEGMMKVES